MITIPQALSVHPYHQSYRPDVFEIGAKIDIFLDGEPQRDVESYNIPAGCIVRAARDKSGELVLIAGEVATEVVFGVVSAELKAG